MPNFGSSCARVARSIRRTGSQTPLPRAARYQQPLAPPSCSRSPVLLMRTWLPRRYARVLMRITSIPRTSAAALVALAQRRASCGAEKPYLARCESPRLGETSTAPAAAPAVQSTAVNGLTLWMYGHAHATWSGTSHQSHWNDVKSMGAGGSCVSRYTCMRYAASGSSAASGG